MFQLYNKTIIDFELIEQINQTITKHENGYKTTEETYLCKKTFFIQEYQVRC